MITFLNSCPSTSLKKRNVTEFVFSRDMPTCILFEECALAIEAAERAVDVSLTTCDIVGLDSHVPWETYSEPLLDCYKAALFLRSDVLEVENTMAFPPSAVDVTCEKAEHCIPPSLHNFLSWLIVEDKGEPQVESLTVEERLHLQKKSDQRLVMSIAQDIIYAATHGCVKTPEHVALPLAVKQMTGSAKTITLLNRFGHGLALTQLREVEAGMAEKMMEQQDGVFVPTNISKGEGFVQFCWNNNYINEETPSGSGTTHCTNGIIILRKVQPTSVTSIDDGQEYSSWRRGCNRRR